MEKDYLRQLTGALIDINRLISSMPDEGTLYDGVCRILVEECGLSHAIVGIPDHQGWVRIVSTNGKMRDRLKNVRISVDPDRPEGRGIFGRAYRNATPIIENHLLDLPEIRIWRPLLREMASGSIAVFPFFRAGTVHGCLSLHAREEDFFGTDIRDLLKGVVVSLSFGVDNSDRRKYQALQDQGSLTLKNYYRALSEINQFLVHIPTPQALFQRVCDILYARGDPKGAVIGIVDPKTEEIIWVAFSGLPAEWVYSIRLTIQPDRPEGQTMTGKVLRSGKPMILNDYLNHPVGQALRSKFEEQGIRAAAVYPICRGGDPVGVLIAFSLFTNFFGNEMDQLLFEMTRNISFSLDNLDRLREQQGNERTILTLKNYYRALSEINALVAHLPSSDELFDRTCEILHRSEESSIVGIGLVNESSGLLDWTHFTGPDSGWISDLRIRVGADASEGLPPRTMSQRVFLAKKSLVVNDYMRELPENSLKPVFREHGIRSAAIYPFFRNGTLTGVLAVVSRETGFFGQELSDLLDGVSRSLSFALDNRDREEARSRQEERAHFLSLHDPLTGLPNRRLFYDRLEQARRYAIRHESSFAVALLDLDGFKTINDALGHSTGDQLLVAVGSGLKTLLRESDTVARLGGDEFAIILHDMAAESLEGTLTRILGVIRGLREVDGQTVTLSGCLGVTVFPVDPSDSDGLLFHADQAMYAVKRQGKDGWTLYQNST